MEPILLIEAAAAMGAEYSGSSSLTVRTICTDTRRLEPGALFFALTGEQQDGHRFVAQALEKGAAAAVVQSPIPNCDGIQLVVPDTLLAFGDLASHYRRRFAIPVIGLTGSVGKTSVREMLAAILQTQGDCLSNEKNYNNELGVPQTLFGIESRHRFAVIEMGMRGSGEIDRLAEIAEPTHGLITCIGLSHIERLGSQLEIARAKTELFSRLPSGGCAVFPVPSSSLSALEHVSGGRELLQSDPLLADEAAIASQIIASIPAGVEPLRYGLEAYADGQKLELSLSEIADEASGSYSANVHWRGETGRLILRSPGRHQLHNAAAALAMACVLAVPLEAALTALNRWQGAEGRLAIRSIDSKQITILDDCYNAGPESMLAALEALSHYTERRVAALGDMRELGSFSDTAHKLVGRAAAGYGVELLLTAGELGEKIAAEAGQAAARDGVAMEIHSFPDSEALAAAVEHLLLPGDTILVKGSRAMSMERIVCRLTGEQVVHG